MSRFEIRLDPIWRIPLLVIGATQRRAFLEIGDRSLTCRFGWWTDEIDLADIDGVEATDWPWIYGIGMRIARGRTLGLIGSTRGAVAMPLSVERLFKVPFKMRFRRIVATLKEPEAFIEALSRALGGGGLSRP